MRESMRYDTDRYQLRDYVLERMIEIVKQNRVAIKGGIVFYGDSLTQYFDVEHYMSSIGKVYNCGIAGITSDMLLNFVDEGVLKYEPSEVFIMVGTNDLGNTTMRSPREIALNIKELIEIIHYNLPECRIHLLSCIPCLEKLHGYKVKDSLRSNDTLKMIGKEYKKMIPFDYVHFINVYPALCNKKGEPIEEYYEDGLHINQKGYEQYAKTILEQVERQVG